MSEFVTDADLAWLETEWRRVLEEVGVPPLRERCSITMRAFAMLREAMRILTFWQRVSKGVGEADYDLECLTDHFLEDFSDD